MLSGTSNPAATKGAAAPLQPPLTVNQNLSNTQKKNVFLNTSASSGNLFAAKK